MFNNVIETIIEGTNEEYLNIPQEEFFFSYDSLNHRNAEDFVKNYFEFKSKDGIPIIKDIDSDNDTNMVRITLEVNYNKKSNREGYVVPDVIENANLSMVDKNE